MLFICFYRNRYCLVLSPTTQPFHCLQGGTLFWILRNPWCQVLAVPVFKMELYPHLVVKVLSAWVCPPQGFYFLWSEESEECREENVENRKTFLFRFIFVFPFFPSSQDSKVP